MRIPRLIPPISVLPLLLLLLLSTATAAAARVRIEHDPKADFTGRATFTWKATAGLAKFREDEPFLEKYLREAITRELQAKGLHFVEAAPADLLVSYRAVVRQRLEVVDDPDWFPRRPWWHDDLDVRSFDEVTYTVDVADGASGEPMWRGSAAEPEAAEGRAQRQIDRLMGRLFRKYPPKP